MPALECSCISSRGLSVVQSVCYRFLRMNKCSGHVAVAMPCSTFTSANPHTRCRHMVDRLFHSFSLKPQDLSVASVHIKDVENTRRKLETLVASGSDSLQVVSDFDRTMSKYRHNDHLTPTCHGIFEMDPELTEGAKTTLTNLRNKYYPVEVDPYLSDAAKIPQMLEWWRLSHDTIVSCGLHRDALAKTVRDCGVVLRDKLQDFTELLYKHQIPVLIFSAGLGDVIELLLENFSMCTENVRVVSNFMEFNEEGLLVGFKDPIIHSFNKTAASIISGDRARIASQRPCVLLLGDSTGDIHMADGATVDDPNGISGTVLRIGFLNESIETNLEKYKTIYDIVLVNDETFTVPLAVMQTILQCHLVYANGGSIPISNDDNDVDRSEH
ncbi:Cytosolic 5' nucleotidase III [Paragonimus heterotremus]|uniref:5'-nucleotidase n=1 Tax=Paragonimus heterotremus TaxID=100268 RepID=A0A8J4TIU5_9TREM|nr:Cytosolic 5' nucleotidase III [Paragonimus heterotremus]